MDVLSADRVTKVYASRKTPVTALTEFSLAVHEGEIFGLLGPNGAGKTTFIKLLLEIAFPTSGRMTLFGRPTSDVSAKSRIGYLPENHRYPPYLTGERVLNYFGKLSGMEGPTLRRAVTDALALVDMARWKDLAVRKYSKGMMQRLGLAQAVINAPALVILDEPTDGVDPVGRKNIRETLAHMRDRGVTVFLNSHLLSEVEMICDRVAILDKGRMVRLGGVRELTRSDRQFDLTVRGEIPEGLLAEWEARRIPVRRDGPRLVVDTSDLATVNAAIDALRGAGVLIESVTPKRTSLEDLFLDVVSKEAS
jgi:ABC-2 type transport system ATP-binding protein